MIALPLGRDNHHSPLQGDATTQQGGLPRLCGGVVACLYAVGRTADRQREAYTRGSALGGGAELHLILPVMPLTGHEAPVRTCEASEFGNDLQERFAPEGVNFTYGEINLCGGCVLPLLCYAERGFNPVGNPSKDGIAENGRSRPLAQLTLSFTESIRCSLLSDPEVVFTIEDCECTTSRCLPSRRADQHFEVYEVDLFAHFMGLHQQRFELGVVRRTTIDLHRFSGESVGGVGGVGVSVVHF